MRSKINLATQPYEDAGRFYTRWLLALALVTIISVVVVYAAASNWRASHDAGRQVRQLKQTLAKLTADQKADETILHEARNQDVRARSELLNDAIRRKAFSWTQVFSELERIMPSGLHVVSIKPELAADNQLAIRMTVAGSSRDRGMELMRHMEESKSFHGTELKGEDNNASQPPDTIRFDISALYTPQPQTPAAADEHPGEEQAKAAATGGGR